MAVHGEKSLIHSLGGPQGQFKYATTQSCAVVLYQESIHDHGRFEERVSLI